MSTILRPATEADLDAVTSIYADAVAHGAATYELEPPSRSEMGERYRALVAGGFPYLVTTVDGAVAGYAYAGPFRARAAYRFAVENSVYVAPDCKGRGVGRLLMQGLIDASTALGFRQIIAVIGDGGPSSASVRLHEAMGFAHSGVLRGSGFKHGRWLDTVLMQLSINGGNTIDPDPDSLPERNFRG